MLSSAVDDHVYDCLINNVTWLTTTLSEGLQPEISTASEWQHIT